MQPTLRVHKFYACKEQLVSGLSRLDCDGGSIELKDRCVEWWVEDLSVLRIDFYHIYMYV